MGADPRAHEVATQVFEHFQAFENGGQEVSAILADVTGEVKGDTVLSLVNMVNQRIHTAEKLLVMPFGGYEGCGDLHQRWERAAIPYFQENDPDNSWDSKGHVPNVIPLAEVFPVRKWEDLRHRSWQSASRMSLGSIIDNNGRCLLPLDPMRARKVVNHIT